MVISDSDAGVLVYLVLLLIVSLGSNQSHGGIVCVYFDCGEHIGISSITYYDNIISTCLYVFLRVIVSFLSSPFSIAHHHRVIILMVKIQQNQCSNINTRMHKT